jgi:hypothetical protein
MPPRPKLSKQKVKWLGPERTQINLETKNDKRKKRKEKNKEKYASHE